MLQRTIKNGAQQQLLIRNYQFNFPRRLVLYNLSPASIPPSQVEEMTEFRSLVELASDAALAISADALVVAWNDRATALLGYAPEHALGRPCYEILQPRLSSGEPVCVPGCKDRLCFVQQAPFAVHDCSLRHKDGNLVRASISTLAAPAPSTNGLYQTTLALVFLRPREDPAPETSADQLIRISTFGRFGLSVGGRPLSIDRWHRKHALTLLKLLATHYHKVVHREHLIECLWANADERRGRERLKVTMHFLRQQLRAAGAQSDVIDVVNGTYALKCDAVWLDCEEFKNLVTEGRLLKRRGRPQDALLCFEQAERLYKGDFLPEERYVDWCAEERERLREIYFDAIGHLIDGYIENGDYERAVEICRLGLACEPCREGIHRALLLCLAHFGQRDRMVDQHHRFRQTLKSELGVEPTPETERFYRDLVADGKSGKVNTRT